jgi:molybdopterin molybdotransferase
VSAEPTRVSVADAIHRILAAIRPLSAESVSVHHALGRVLAEDIAAPYAHPAWDNSAMDGYAVHADDLGTIPCTLTVAGTIAAGHPQIETLHRGTAWRIMTGAPLPTGADTVIRVEDTDAGTASVTITNARDARRNIRPHGEDFRAGATVVASGTKLRPAHLGLLATVGRATVQVTRAPRVAILGSGNELVDVDRFAEVMAGRRIINSNAYTLAATVAAIGATPVPLETVPDDPTRMADALRSRPPVDAIITTGGISVGAFDHTRDVLAQLGASLDFWRVRMRPGGPFGFGMLDGTPWFGLPGNPVSSLVTCALFVLPALRRAMGLSRCVPVPVDVRLAEPISIHAPLTHFLRAVVTPDDRGVLEARLTGPQGSGLLTSMALANALLVVPHDTQQLPVGATASAVLLNDDERMADRWLR